MGKRTEKSRKKSKFLFLVILLAALISITGTYAWFSTQRDVEIIGFKINVEIAENLEISLDGERWAHTIQIANMRQFYGTYTGGLNGTNAGTNDVTSVYQAKKDQNRNYVPTELLPVSTIGAVEDGNMIFATGSVKDKKLSNITKCSEADITIGQSIRNKEANNDQHPYLVFDMYLRNLSRLTSGGDILQINTGSTVSAGVANTGLEYCVRVGFVKYGGTVSIQYQDADVGEKIRAIAPSEDDSEEVAIWEPNSKFHIPFVVTNDDRVSAAIEAIETRAIAVTKAGVPATEIENIVTADDTLLKSISTNKPKQSELESDIKAQKYETTELHNMLSTTGNEFRIAPNAISKIRCYIWLEGQDPDCVDLSSTGDEVQVTLRLIKPKSNIEGGNNSYAD